MREPCKASHSGIPAGFHQQKRRSSVVMAKERDEILSSGVRS
jgi:hypothetical protein